MDIYTDEPFRRIVFDVVGLIKNSHDYLVFTSEKIEITSDEFFSRVENLRDNNELNTILDLLKKEGVLNDYKTETDKKLDGMDGNDWITDVYTLNVNSKNLNTFMDKTNIATDLKGVRDILGTVIRKNGLTMNLPKAILDNGNGKEIVNFSLDNNYKKMLALLMANNGIIPIGFLYQELGISEDERNPSVWSNNLKKTKSLMIKFLKNELGLSEHKVETMLVIIKKVGITMVDIK